MARADGFDHSDAMLILRKFLAACLVLALAAPPAADKPGRLRLYVIDCGTLIFDHPETYELRRDEVADTTMSVTCFLVVHPKGVLLFDTGLSDRLVGLPRDDTAQGGSAQLKRTRLSAELAAIGEPPSRITYLALSHSHFDHVGNANLFFGSTWLARKSEYDTMFGSDGTAHSPDYAALRNAPTRFVSGDYDVFGDGTVVLKSTPGHTPGHQSLYVRLPRTGGVVIAGDLYLYPEERTLNRMSERERHSETPASRAAMEVFLRRAHAQLWIGHSMTFFRSARKAPDWYD